MFYNLDDLYAPPFICAALFFAVGFNFYLKYNPRMAEGKIDTETILNYSNLADSSLADSNLAAFNIQN